MMTNNGRVEAHGYPWGGSGAAGSLLLRFALNLFVLLGSRMQALKLVSVNFGNTIPIGTSNQERERQSQAVSLSLLVRLINLGWGYGAVFMFQSAGRGHVWCKSQITTPSIPTPVHQFYHYSSAVSSRSVTHGIYGSVSMCSFFVRIAPPCALFSSLITLVSLFVWACFQEMSSVESSPRNVGMPAWGHPSSIWLSSMRLLNKMLAGRFLKISLQQAQSVFSTLALIGGPSSLMESKARQWWSTSHFEHLSSESALRLKPLIS